MFSLAIQTGLRISELAGLTSSGSRQGRTRAWPRRRLLVFGHVENAPVRVGELFPASGAAWRAPISS